MTEQKKKKITVYEQTFIAPETASKDNVFKESFSHNTCENLRGHHRNLSNKMFMLLNILFLGDHPELINAPQLFSNK